MDKNLKKMVARHDWEVETYDAEYFKHLGLYHKITLDNVKRFLPVNKDAPVLDAGGGTGIWSLELARLGYRVVLTDLSDGMLAKARAKIAEAGLEERVDVRRGDIRRMPEFADGEFAMVVCEGDPLSYCRDHEAAVRELARVVCRGGAVVASVDNRASGLNWLRESDPDAVERLIENGEIVFPADREEFRYEIHAFTPEELKGLFESNGLSVERMIGKTVIAHRLAARDSEDPAVQEWLFELELAHCDDPAYVPWAGHLEIVGRKR